MDAGQVGIGTVACGPRRNVQIAAERRGKMKKRLGRIRTLARQDRRCKALIFTGAKPQGTWGHQAAGLAPSTILQVRRSFAAAAMIRRPGGCATTAFSLGISMEADPAVAKCGIPPTTQGKYGRREKHRLGRNRGAPTADCAFARTAIT